MAIQEITETHIAPLGYAGEHACPVCDSRAELTDDSDVTRIGCTHCGASVTVDSGRGSIAYARSRWIAGEID